MFSEIDTKDPIAVEQEVQSIRVRELPAESLPPCLPIRREPLRAQAPILERAKAQHPRTIEVLAFAESDIHVLPFLSLSPWNPAESQDESAYQGNPWGWVEAITLATVMAVGWSSDPARSSARVSKSSSADKGLPYGRHRKFDSLGRENRTIEFSPTLQGMTHPVQYVCGPDLSQ